MDDLSLLLEDIKSEVDNLLIGIDKLKNKNKILEEIISTLDQCLLLLGEN